MHEYYTLITDLEKQLKSGRKSQEEWRERYEKLLQRFKDFQLKDHAQVVNDLIFNKERLEEERANRSLDNQRNKVECAKYKQQIKDMAKLNLTEQGLKKDA